MANFFRPDPKPVKEDKKKKPYKYIPENTGQAKLFKEIALERPHKSFIDDENIYPLTAINFIHVLAKGLNQYPLFKKYKKNIVLGTETQHTNWDKGEREELRKKPEWNKMFTLEQELKEEYDLLLIKLKGPLKHMKINPADYQHVTDNIEKYLQ